uniref:INO80 complex subunit C n=1 Tax=Aotus nancymaae TaxID=37293 RepID=A0A2K5D6D2_AOTNA
MAAQIPIVATTSTPGIIRNSKKRPASPSHNSSSGGGYGSSKKKKMCASSFAQGISMEAMSENKMVPSEFSTGPVEKATKPLPFKDPNFVHSGHGGAVAGKKNRTWKNLKQILASERALPWQLNDPNYFSIDAPPSFKPAKKYSDVSGLLEPPKCFPQRLHQFTFPLAMDEGSNFSRHPLTLVYFGFVFIIAILVGVK